MRWTASPWLFGLRLRIDRFLCRFLGHRWTTYEWRGWVIESCARCRKCRDVKEGEA